MKEEDITIVVVDDEEMVVSSIESFLSLQTEYNVQPFISVTEALAYIKKNEIDLVVSDYLMPEMNGIQFLGEVRKLQPNTPRIILTGYADKENAIKAINEVGLFQYIEKPWENDELLLIFRNAIEKKQLMMQLKQKIDEINKAYGDFNDLQKEIVKTFI
jgi:DNA-binding NtrC family response regulator